MKEFMKKKNQFLFLITLIYTLVSCVSSNNKRGISWPLENRQDSPKLFANGKVKWFYNWSADKRSDVNLEFVPMYWSANLQKPEEFVKKVLSQNAKVILGFNEPERNDQARMDPVEAARIWKKYIEPLRSKGIRLGSPSISSTEDGLRWLDKFLKQGAKIDFLSLHWYGRGFGNFINYIYQARQRLGSRYPVWITEFGCTSWNRNQPVSQNEINQFFQQSINHLDKLSWVERYAWFGAARRLDLHLGMGNRLIADNGQLSNLGRKYVHG